MEENEVIWTGEFPITLSWRDDYFGPPGRSLFAGNICIGTIIWTSPERKNWRAWLRTSDYGDEIGWFDTRGEAETALVDAALAALRK
jgi:hypothetical protein